MKKSITLMVLVALALSACATPTATEAPKATAAPAATTAPVATEAPKATAAPTTPALRTKANPGEKITLYHYGDVTGPYAAITAPLVSGFDDAVKALNAKGGIRGAQVAVEWSDTGGKLENAISTYNRFREKKPLILFMYGSTETEGLKDRLAEDKIPNLTFGVSGPGSYPPGWVFAGVPIYSDQFGLFLDWLTANWAKVKPAKGQNLDAPRVAVVTWDTAYGRGALTPETQAYADKKGVKIVSKEFFADDANSCRKESRSKRDLHQHPRARPGANSQGLGLARCARRVPHRRQQLGAGSFDARAGGSRLRRFLWSPPEPVVG
ncbi:MAG: ABC transporter substrate-binding protein [Chloroflexi bacterium]|nr:ABC transporter substrate-binding protein [Chloroflexota bacterium]